MNQLKSFMSVAVGGLFLSGCVTVYAGSLELKETQKLNLSADGIEKIDIKAGAGFLKYKGVKGLSEIRVVADLEVDPDSYRLELNKKGSKAVLIANANTQSFGFVSNSPKIDLTIEVPASLSVEIDDGSGFIEIEGVSGEINIEDGSGSLEATNVSGDLKIDDGSGNVILKDIQGNIKLNDGSGSIEILNVSQSVDIDDGSGGIDIKSVGGKLDIVDGSGSMILRNIAGHVTIDDGSGSIDVKELDDGLTILNAGSGGVSIKNVKGSVTYDD